MARWTHGRKGQDLHVANVYVRKNKDMLEITADNGVFSCLGKVVYYNHPTFKNYFGTWREDTPGLPHGNGYMQFVSGEIYRGEWQTGSRNGDGYFAFSSDNNSQNHIDRKRISYKGQWMDDRIFGVGILIL